MSFCGSSGTLRPWDNGHPSTCFLLFISSVLPVSLFAAAAVAPVLRWRRMRGYEEIADDADAGEIVVRDSRLYVSKLMVLAFVLAGCTTALVLSVRGSHEGVPAIVPFAYSVSAAATLLVAAVTVLERRCSAAVRSTWANVAFHVFAALSMVPLAFVRGHFDVTDGGVAISLLVVFALHVLGAVLSLVSCLVDVRVKRYGALDPPEDRASLLSRMTMGWLDPLLQKGNRQPLDLEDVWNLTDGDKSNAAVDDFGAACRRQARRGKTSLLRNLLAFVGRSLALQGVFAFFGGTLEMLQPLLLNMVLIYIARRGDDGGAIDSRAYLYVVGLLLMPIAQSLADGQNYFLGRRIGIRVRAALVSAIYGKSLRVSMAQVAQAALDADKKKSGGKKKGSVTSSGGSEEEPLLGGGDGDDGADDHVDDEYTGDDSAKSFGSAGQIANLMSVDTARLIESIAYIHFLWTAPLMVIFCCCMLYRYLGWASMAGLVCMLATMPINAVCAAKIGKCQRRLMAMKDERISSMGELLAGIRIIKMHVWERDFEDRVNAARSKELKSLSTFNYSIAVLNTVWYATPAMVSAVSFLARYFILREPLNATDSFTALALFNALQFPLNVIPDMFNDCILSYVSLKRIERFLDSDEIAPLQAASDFVAVGEIVLSGASCGYASSAGLADAVIRDVTLRCLPGTFTCVAGATGSGKSSLLAAIIGELNVLAGSIEKRGSVAYVAQQAWIQNASLRENILFGSPFEEDRYARVIFACALTADIESLESGDLTEIGEKGINLSGGQKQRVSLARAVYANSDIYILDDCLSAVDAHVGRHIFEHCIDGILRTKTRVLVTHQVALCIPRADNIVYMQGGRVEFSGPYSAYLANEATMRRLLADAHTDEGAVVTADGTDEMNAAVRRGVHGVVRGGEMEIDPAPPASILPLPSSSFATDGAAVEAEVERALRAVRAHTAARALIDKEERAKGSIATSTYVAYIRASGGWVAFAVLVLGYAAGQVTGVLQSNWLRMWIDAQQGNSGNSSPLAVASAAAAAAASSSCNISTLNVGIGALVPQLAYGYSPRDCDSLLGAPFNATRASLQSGPVRSAAATHDFYIYIGITIATIALVLCRSFVQAWIGLRGAVTYHARLLRSVLGAPVAFFDRTPLGRVINRFSNDLAEIDQRVVESIGACLNYALMAVSVIAVIIAVTPAFVAGVVPILLLNALVARYYLKTSRELKRLDSITKSPVYAFFSETLAGLSTIRAYGAQGRFAREIGARVDTNHRAFFYLWVANRWLNIRISVLGAVISFGAGLSAVLASSVDAGKAGLSLSYALGFTEAVLWFIRYQAQMELEMNAVERAEQYIAIEQEPPAVIPDRRPPPGWPTHGAVDIDSLVVRYPGSESQVLGGVSLSIAPREKVGIVGRTGAGKSTLAVCFFRFMEAESGRILIDGVDISTIGLHDLRGRLCIIPQEPVLFTGTLRSNLDPFGRHTDEEIWQALERVVLMRRFAVEDVGLDAPITENGGNLSVGQRQLVCLARALLHRSAVLIMDEATANVDNETDECIQRTIRGEFRDSTVLTIAHRLKTVLDYDKIVVMDRGRVVECGAPAELMSRANGHFWRLCMDSDDPTILSRLA